MARLVMRKCLAILRVDYMTSKEEGFVVFWIAMMTTSSKKACLPAINQVKCLTTSPDFPREQRCSFLLFPS